MGDFNDYITKYVDSDTQEERRYDSLYSKNLKVGDLIEVREYEMYALPVKINGVETSYEKEGHYVWGDTTTDMTIIAMAIVLYV